MLIPVCRQAGVPSASSVFYPNFFFFFFFAAENDSKWFFYEGNYREYENNKIQRLGEEAAKPHRVRFKALK